MKKWIKGLLLLLVLQFALVGCGSKDESNLITKRVLKELVFYENDVKKSIATYEYDIYGKKVKEIKRYPDDKLMYTIKFFYDDNGLLIKEDKFRAKYGLKVLTTYEYDDNGNQTLKLITRYNKKKQLTQEQFLEQKFDENSNLLEKKEYVKKATGEIITENYETFKYNEKGLKIEHYIKNFIQHNKATFFYDSENRQIKVIIEYQNKDLISTVETEYNLEMNEKINITSDNGEIISYWKTVKNDKGKKILSERKDGKGNITKQDRWKYIYDEQNRVIRCGIYDKDNYIKHLFTYEYDEFGSLIKDSDHNFSGAVFMDTTSKLKEIYDSGKGLKLSRNYSYENIKIKKN